MFGSPAELVAVLTAITALVGALTAMFIQLRRLEIRVDGRLTQLLALTEKASKAEGVLAATGTPTPLPEATDWTLPEDPGAG